MPNIMIKKGKKPIFTKIILIAAVIIIVIFAIFLYPQIVTKECTSAGCLTERAEKCLPTVYTETVDNMIIEHRILTDCTAASKIVGFTESVPQEYSDRFLGKETTCQYNKGQYQTEILESDTQICTFT